MKDAIAIPLLFLRNADFYYVLFLQALQIFASLGLFNDSLPFFSTHSHFTPNLNLKS